ncbi:MAG: sel1 repeat family protein [Hyphomicrobiaceae bacterium]|nr:sel1 repeat family protein [Hyphomicrobiaceae bacterium]
MSATRIFRTLVGLALFSALASTAGLAARGGSFTSPQAAFEHGMGALKAGRLDIALPALEHAAGKGLFLAEFYLARLFADSTGTHTDHAKAYMLYQRIADEHADIDPDDDQRAPFVAKAFTALAAYLRQGIPVIGLYPNPERAAEYLQHAATFFNDQDAQFELAKLYLKGEGVPEDTKRATHWLSVLTEEGHAGAQAFLADLYWRGKHVPKDSIRAYALVTVAVENAPAHERIWIEDIHQYIYCGLSEHARRNAEGLVSDWRRRYGRQSVVIDRYGLARLQLGPVRTCSNGEPVRVINQGPGDLQLPSNVGTGGIATSALRGTDTPPMVKGNVLGFGVREAGDTAPDRSR